jgi:hypothetical protein
MPADELHPQDTPKFRSPKRSLALSFRLSRDRWKAKATRRLQQIQAFRVRVRDLQTSRDLWKAKAQHLQRQLEELQGLASAALQPNHQPAGADSLTPPAQAEPTSTPADQPAASLAHDAAALAVPPHTSAKKKRSQAGESSSSPGPVS